MTRRTALFALAGLLAAPAAAQDGDPPSVCTPEAAARAASRRSLRCTRCDSYEVVSSGDDRYTCCHCGRSAAFSGFVRRR